MSTTAPYNDQNHAFWQFVADLHEQGPAHPFFARQGGAAANNGSDEERPNPWNRRRHGPMRMRGGHGPHHHGPRHHARFAQQDEEMRDLTSDTEVDEKVRRRSARASQEPEADAALSGDESRRGPHGRHGGRMGMGGRGRGRGAGFRGGRGGMGPRFAQAGPNEIPSDGENFNSGGESRRGSGMRRGAGRMAGRGRGLGGPGARAAASPIEVSDATMASDAEKQQSGDEKPRGPGARRGGRMGGRGRGGPRAHASREVLFDATATGQSDDEKAVAVSGDEMQHGPGRRRGGPGMGGRGRGAGMGRGRGGRGAEGAGPGHRGRHGPHGPHGPHAMHHQEHNATGPRATGRHADGKIRPDADVFDHPEAYIVHISVPGAKKEDIEVNWDADKSALRIKGTMNRTEDEEILKTLSQEERKVGQFRRGVRLGNRVTPAQVDVEGIKARIEDGVLRIEVPKVESGFVEIKRVDVA